jgi:hypothetical protein
LLWVIVYPFVVALFGAYKLQALRQRVPDLRERGWKLGDSMQNREGTRFLRKSPSSLGNYFFFEPDEAAETRLLSMSSSGFPAEKSD